MYKLKFSLSHVILIWSFVSSVFNILLSIYLISFNIYFLLCCSSCTSINFWEQKQSCSFKFCLNESSTIVYCIQCWVLLDNTDATAKSLSFSLSPSFSAYRPRRTPCKYYDSRRRWPVGKETNSPRFDALIVSQRDWKWTTLTRMLTIRKNNSLK